MGLSNLVDGVQVAAVVCNQFGDTGKGKFSDYLASQWADVIARGTGGNNAGHTVVVNGKQRIFHLIPAGITEDANGKVNILGNGMVDDLEVLCGELDCLDAEGLSYNNLMISQDAHVILPCHVESDKAKNQSQKKGGIGSTGRGIGPCYTDKIARRGVMVRELFDKDVMARKLNKLKEYYPDSDFSDVVERLKPYADRIKPFVRDTVSEMHKFYREGRKILLEGAQGLLLSIEHGTYPYVTSSDCSLNGTATGVGLSAKAVDLPLGIVKFPFMTRVGAGPFPTELGGRQSEVYCAEDGHTITDELVYYGIPFEMKEGRPRYDKRNSKILDMIASSDEFLQGIGIRLAAGEYGATTGRPRRTGWTDAVAARYAVGINGPLMVLTKADCLSDTGDFNLCFGYQNTLDFSRDAGVLGKANPFFKRYDGYSEISSARDYCDLPKSLKTAIGDLEVFTRGKVLVVSVGAERDETIVRK